MTQFLGKLGGHGAAEYHLLSELLESFNQRLARFRGDVSEFVSLMEEFREKCRRSSNYASPNRMGI